MSKIKTKKHFDDSKREINIIIHDVHCNLCNNPDRPRYSKGCSCGNPHDKKRIRELENLIKLYEND